MYPKILILSVSTLHEVLLSMEAVTRNYGIFSDHSLHLKRLKIGIKMNKE